MRRFGQQRSEAAGVSHGSPKSRADHMARRAKHQSQAQTAKEFGKSQSTVSRSMLRNGFVGQGSAR